MSTASPRPPNIGETSWGEVGRVREKAKRGSSRISTASSRFPAICALDGGETGCGESGRDCGESEQGASQPVVDGVGLCGYRIRGVAKCSACGSLTQGSRSDRDGVSRTVGSGDGQSSESDSGPEETLVGAVEAKLAGVADLEVKGDSRENSGRSRRSVDSFISFV